MTEIKGQLFLHSETGTEGGYWAIQDEKSTHGENDLVDGECPWGETKWCPVVRGDWHQHSSYDGLIVVRDGDKLAVFDNVDEDSVIFQTTVQLVQQYNQYADDAVSAYGLVIHSYPDQSCLGDKDFEFWCDLFFGEHRAVLERDS